MPQQSISRAYLTGLRRLHVLMRKEGLYWFGSATMSTRAKDQHRCKNGGGEATYGATMGDRTPGPNEQGPTEQIQLTAHRTRTEVMVYSGQAPTEVCLALQTDNRGTTSRSARSDVYGLTLKNHTSSNHENYSENKTPQPRTESRTALSPHQRTLNHGTKISTARNNKACTKGSETRGQGRGANGNGAQSNGV